jgi:hypothetical protein
MPSQTTRLLQLAADVELFATPEGVPFGTVPVGDHREHWPLRSRAFRRWLARRFYLETGSSPNAQALIDALGVLEAQALFGGTIAPVFVRVAEHGGNLYIDLADAHWRAVEVTPRGWCVVERPPVRFRRPAGMLPLPEPARGGTIEELRPFVNVATEADWKLLVAWLLGALQARGPYPVLALHGEQGTAKTTTARVLRALVDPNTAAVRAEPRDVRDLMIAAANGWMQVFDNLSRLPAWLSDALCRLSTGGGFATRKLYSDADEVLLDAVRPVALTSIEEVVARGDLLDRSIIVDLPPIPEERRRPEEQFWAAFAWAQPRILGALLDAVATALARMPTLQLVRLPRMADFARWIAAAEPALGWVPGEAIAAYRGNRAAAHELALDASSVALAVRALLDGRDEWRGTATDLLAALNATDEVARRHRGWPQTARALSGSLRRLAPDLRAVGLEVGFARTGRGRLVIIRRQGGAMSVTTVTSVTDGVLAPSLGDADGDANDGPGAPGDANPNGQDARLEGRSDGSDDSDAPVPQRSAIVERPRVPWPEAAVGFPRRDPGPPDGPCWACRRHRFWVSVHGSLACAVCHPPTASDLLRRWWVRCPSGRWLALRPARQARRLRVISPPKTVRAAIQAFLARQDTAP